MPHREPKKVNRHGMDKTYEERQIHRYLTKGANMGHILALENRIEELRQAMSITTYCFDALVAIMDKKRNTVPGFRIFRKGKLKLHLTALIQDRIARQKAAEEAAAKALEAEKEATETQSLQEAKHGKEAPPSSPPPPENVTTRGAPGSASALHLMAMDDQPNRK